MHALVVVPGFSLPCTTWQPPLPGPTTHLLREPLPFLNWTIPTSKTTKPPRALLSKPPFTPTGFPPPSLSRFTHTHTLSLSLSLSHTCFPLPFSVSLLPLPSPFRSLLSCNKSSANRETQWTILNGYAWPAHTTMMDPSSLVECAVRSGRCPDTCPSSSPTEPQSRQEPSEAWVLVLDTCPSPSLSAASRGCLQGLCPALSQACSL